MNIQDIKEVPIPDCGLYTSMFAMQGILMDKYGPIERANGHYYPDYPPKNIPIDNGQYQHWLKEMFWRVTEEIAEACEELPDLKGDYMRRWDHDNSLQHFWEELADSLHFLIEASIMVGVNPTDLELLWGEVFLEVDKAGGEHIERNSYNVKLLLMNVILFMGLAANTLKNKPWKVSQMKTDFTVFMVKLMGAWYQLFWFMHWCGINLPTMYQLYARKHAVNTFRQRTRY
jgi:hypothetical protein